MYLVSIRHSPLPTPSHTLHCTARRSSPSAALPPKRVLAGQCYNMLKNPTGAAAGAAKSHAAKAQSAKLCCIGARAKSTHNSQKPNSSPGLSFSHSTTHLNEDCTKAPAGKWAQKQQQLLLAPNHQTATKAPNTPSIRLSTGDGTMINTRQGPASTCCCGLLLRQLTRALPA
jgi:hypothetical protein